MITAQEVLNNHQKKEFLEFPARLYRNDKSYIRPHDKDIEHIFDVHKNKFFEHGECKRYLFIDRNGKTVGKVAVFVNHKYLQKQPTGGIGFFDCINDQETADFIFDHCKKWLQERGMEAMDGSINFGERDKFWGVLIEGFSEPLYGMNYNFPYYKDLFENYGFQIYYNQLCFSRKAHAPTSRIFNIMHAKHSKNESFSAKPVTKSNINKFAEDFYIIYNKSWESHGGGKQMSLNDVKKLFNSMKPVMNEHIAWFAYENGNPIAMWINIPDLNQWFKYLNGKFGFFDKLKFLYYKATKTNTKFVGLIFGVLPEWQNKGVEGYLIVEAANHFRVATEFIDFEMQWIGDFNPKMLGLAKHLETEITRKLATYRFLFDRSKEFERHPML
ncbi:hypothetical protein [Chryseobacterium aquaticum]|uniref:hypothetical protein n=1 Tax=Chryseobacterium aquaticum TaxID=452084 RepID=UPI002FCC6BD3